jgi:hypothetical protein
MMNEQELTDFLEANKDDILAASKAAIIEQVTRSVQYTLPSGVSEIVSTFMKDEITPEIKKHLEGQKGAIVEASIKAAASIADDLAKALVQKAAANMAGYRLGEITKALFQ